MKTILISMLALLLCSCHVKQETDIEINPRPSLVLGYEYLNDKGNNTLYQEVRKLNVAVINEQGETVSRADILKNQMSEYRPLYGVPEGEYTVVTFGNTDSTTVTSNAACVSLTLRYKGETLVHFPLSEYLSDSKAGIDLLNGRDITIPIELDVTTAGVGITINDWQTAEVQWSNVGL